MVGQGTVYIALQTNGTKTQSLDVQTGSYVVVLSHEPPMFGG
jgi:hypothetical protein